VDHSCSAHRSSANRQRNSDSMKCLQTALKIFPVVEIIFAISEKFLINSLLLVKVRAPIKRCEVS